MADKIQIPVEVDERLQQLYSPLRGFPGWSDYLSTRNGVVDPLSWLKGRSAANYAEALAHCCETHGRALLPLSQFNCQAGALMFYLEGAIGAGGENAETKNWTPIPLAFVGHILVLVHFDPQAKAPTFLPEHLTSMAWVSLDDYLKLREDFQERVFALRDAIQGRTFTGLTQKTPNTSVRQSLEWVAKQPTIDTASRNAIEFLLALPDSELRLSRLPGDLQCSLNSLQDTTRQLAPAGAIRVDSEVLAKITNRVRCTELGFLPFAATARTVFVAVENDAAKIRDELASIFPGLKVLLIRISAEGIRTLLADDARNRGTGQQQKAHEGEEDLKGCIWTIDPNKFSGKNLRHVREQVEEMICFILAEATTQRTSDIHLDIFHGQMRVRYRIDGVAFTAHSLNAEAIARIANILKDKVCKKSAKSASPLSPQEGDFSFAFLGKRVNCRVTIFYAYNDVNKPRIVMRILDMNSGIRDLSLLGLYPDELETVRRGIKQHNGIVIVSGPTGSGKSTTLNACLGEINSPSDVLYSLEDPIEYRVEGVAKFAVASREGEQSDGRVTFADGLRLLMRMDPDSMMVGEVRDLATADMALEAANTGHLVFTTTHANTAVDVIKRLMSMKVNLSNLGSNIKLLIAQRLVPRLCSCHRQVPTSEEVKRACARYRIQPKSFMGEAVGCTRCRNTGYQGRFVVMELLEVGDAIADLIADGAPFSNIRKAALETPGFRPMFGAGLRRVVNGQTSFAALKDEISDPLHSTVVLDDAAAGERVAA